VVEGSSRPTSGRVLPHRRMRKDEPASRMRTTLVDDGDLDAEWLSPVGKGLGRRKESIRRPFGSMVGAHPAYRSDAATDGRELEMIVTRKPAARITGRAAPGDVVNNDEEVFVSRFGAKVHRPGKYSMGAELAVAGVC